MEHSRITTAHDAPYLRHLRSLALLAFLCASLAFAACGGGGGDGDGDVEGDNNDPGNEPPITQVIVTSTPELDGVVAGDNATVQSRSDLQPAVGDFQFISGVTQGAPRAVSYFSFDLTGVPAGRTVQSATLSLFNRAIQGDPKGMAVLIRIDHVNYGDVFPVATLGGVGLDFNFATINDIDVLGRKDIDVTTQVQSDLGSNRGRSQYRLRGAIASNLDNIADIALLTDGEDSQGSGELPMLIIELD